jgi:hypothetical protein
MRRVKTASDRVQRVRNILESFFDWSGLGFYKAFGPNPDHTSSFLNRTKSDVQVLVIQLWSRGSRMTFYNGSHLQSLKARPAANGLLEIPESHLVRSDITSKQVDLKDGGL